MNKMKLLAPAFALALGASVLFASNVPASLAQQGQDDPRNQGKAPGACFICGSLDYVFVDGADWFGTLAEDACKKYLGGNRASPETRRSYCDQVKSKVGRVCPQAAGTCDSPNGKYCGNNMPDKGFVYSDGGGGGLHEEPSSNSPTLATVPKGGRYLYTKTMRTPDGQTWYFISVPGAPKMGWVPGSDVSCTRPTVPPPPRPSNDDKTVPAMEKLAPGISAAQTTSSRG